MLVQITNEINNVASIFELSLHIICSTPLFYFKFNPALPVPLKPHHKQAWQVIVYQKKIVICHK